MLAFLLRHCAPLQCQLMIQQNGIIWLVQAAKRQAGTMVTVPAGANAPFYDGCMEVQDGGWHHEAEALSLLQLLGQAQHQRVSLCNLAHASFCTFSAVTWYNIIMNQHRHHAA